MQLRNKKKLNYLDFKAEFQAVLYYMYLITFTKVCVDTAIY